MPHNVRRTSELCAYCGLHLSTRKGDHPIPKCLFAGPLPSDMVVVPACRPCNLEKSADDDFLRDMIVTDVFCSEQPGAQALLTGPVLRSVQRNSSEIAKLAVNHGRLAPLYSPGGIYLGDYPSFPVDGDRIQRIYARIARGLYYKIRKTRLPATCDFQVQRILLPADGAELGSKMLAQPGCNGPYRLSDVFGCLFMYGAEDPTITYWLLWFFDSMFVTVASLPAGGLSP